MQVVWIYSHVLSTSWLQVFWGQWLLFKKIYIFFLPFIFPWYSCKSYPCKEDAKWPAFNGVFWHQPWLCITITKILSWGSAEMPVYCCVCTVPGVDYGCVSSIGQPPLFGDRSLQRIWSPTPAVSTNRIEHLYFIYWTLLLFLSSVYRALWLHASCAAASKN